MEKLNSPSEVSKIVSAPHLESEISFESERLTFRPSWHAKKEELSEVANDLDIAIAVGEMFPHPYTIKEAENYLEYAKSSWDSGSEYNFGIFDKESNKYIGNIGFKVSVDGSEITNIGYWLGKAHHGKGLATESLKEIVKFIWSKFKNVKIIRASAYEYNVASQKVLENCGFTKEDEMPTSVSLRNGMITNNIKYVLKK